MSTKEELLGEFKVEKDRLARVEAALAIQKDRVSAKAKEIFEAHGAGPHDLGDGKPDGYKIQCRGGTTYYFVAVVPKGKKPETAESHA
jgi:hypothetical protein